MGKEITMHTYSSDEQAATLGYLTTYDPILSQTIMTSDDPTRNGRYSRYGKDERTSSDKIPNASKKDNDIINTFCNQRGKPQWKIFQETGVTPAVVMVLFESLPMERTIGQTETASTFHQNHSPALNYSNEFAEAMKDEAVKNRLFDEE